MIDRATVVAKGGAGGNGAVSFHREKFVPRGGPDGGDGARGGDVILVADASEDTLLAFNHRRLLKAGPGANGGPNNRHGKKGTPLRVKVPVGTMVYREDGDSRELLGDLTSHGQEVTIARGGLGGWGNARFSTARRQAPHFAERGLPGEEHRIQLELKLLADVGIIGVPNAGKSTLLGAISAAHPRVGSYPFTTLEPALGVVERGYRRLVFADIPGLIQGAHEGVGLGLDFLRHIERTRLLLHLLDGSSDAAGRDYDTVNSELARYRAGLELRPQVVAINKIDLPEVSERVPEIAASLGRRGVSEFCPISAAGRLGLDELLDVVFRRVAELPAESRPEEELAVLRPRARATVEIDREGETFVVRHRRAEMLARMLDVSNYEARRELVERLRRMGVAKALERAGARTGDPVRIGEAEWAWEG